MSHQQSQSPPLHARVDASAITGKPHNLSTSPPPPGSPMPPTASLTSPLDSAGRQLPSTNSSGQDGTSAEASSSRTGGTLSPPITVAPPAEVEATLTKLTSHKHVTGCLVLSRPEALIIRSGGKDFEPSGPGAHDRSEKLRKVVKMVKVTMDTLSSGVSDLDKEDDLGLIRIRTKKYEMIISPSDKYLLVVLQDPSISP